MSGFNSHLHHHTQPSFPFMCIPYWTHTHGLYESMLSNTLQSCIASYSGHVSKCRVKPSLSDVRHTFLAIKG